MKEVISNLTILDVIQLAKHLSDRDKLILFLLNETSAKVSEISNIKIKDIKKQFIQIKNRKIQISNELKSLIKNYCARNNLQKNDYLFKTRQSQKISSKRIRQIIQNSSKKFLGIKLNPEQIRKLSIKNKLLKKQVSDVKKEVGLKRLDKRRILSLKEISILRKKITDLRTFLIFELLLNGLKSKEISKLKFEDILSPKIPENTITKLEDFVKKNKISYGESIFKTRQKTPITKERIFQIIKQLGKSSGIDVSPRILNNTYLAKNHSDLTKFHLYGGFYEE